MQGAYRITRKAAKTSPSPRKGTMIDVIAKGNAAGETAIYLYHTCWSVLKIFLYYFHNHYISLQALTAQL